MDTKIVIEYTTVQKQSNNDCYTEVSHFKGECESSLKEEMYFSSSKKIPYCSMETQIFAEVRFWVVKRYELCRLPSFWFSASKPPFCTAHCYAETGHAKPISSLPAGWFPVRLFSRAAGGIPGSKRRQTGEAYALISYLSESIWPRFCMLAAAVVFSSFFWCFCLFHVPLPTWRVINIFLLCFIQSAEFDYCQTPPSQSYFTLFKSQFQLREALIQAPEEPPLKIWLPAL